MTETSTSLQLGLGGIEIYGESVGELNVAQKQCLNYIQRLGLDACAVVTRHSDDGRESIRFHASDVFARDWAPHFDTTQLCEKLGLSTQSNPDDLEHEIVLTMLLGPVLFAFPSFGDMLSAVRIRRNIVQNARKTALAFDTEHAERPADYWTYSEETGFVLLPGAPLILALEKATQPDSSGQLYSFSCYRATEYVMLLGIAQELAECNPSLFEQLQRQWETRAIMSGQFHEVFLREYGSMDEPLPPKYYVPGDRLWFRNPDEASSDVKGYEGSWVIYMGGGLFTNFWKRDQPYTLITKSLELFHWRNATYRDSDGGLQVDDDIVDERVRVSLQDPDEVRRILDEMLRLRDPSGVYVDGGCIDTTRECARWVRPGTADLQLPDGN
ncbi:MAG TPA: hypothetical protein VIP51_05020 [Eoetvoesiella sp.]